jgi:hypothetical protein
MIAMENPDGTVTAVYCHNDGYLEHNGRILHNHYSDPEKVKDLISLGGLSSLGEQVAPPAGESHRFNSQIQGVTVAYRRDRGDAFRHRKHKSVSHFFNGDIEAYGYLFTQEGEWLVKKYDGVEPLPLGYVLAMKGIS